MQLNTLSQIVHDEWICTVMVRKNVVLDKFVVMPNHVHVLFWIVEDDAPGDTPTEIGMGVSQYAPLA